MNPRQWLCQDRVADRSRPYLFSCLLLLLWLTSPHKATASLDPARPLNQFMYQNWQAQQGLPQNSVLAIAQTRDGYIWVGTEEGLARFDGVRFTSFDLQNAGFRNNIAQVLLADREDNLWIGTRGGGLIKYSKGKFTRVDTNNSHLNTTITALYEDRDGNLWIGTPASLTRLHGNSFRTFTTRDGLPGDGVWSITQDLSGDLWFATHDGLSRYTKGTFKNLGVKDGLGSNYVRAIRTDRHGTIWAGTSNGLSRVSPAGISNLSSKNGLSSNEIYSLDIDRAGTIWIGTESGGLNRLANGKLSNFSDPAKTLGNLIWAILEDTEGNLWVGLASRGLSVLKQGPFSNLTVDEGLPSNTVLPVFEDRQGALWVGTDRGLIRRDRNGTVLITKENGLPDNFVFSLAQDLAGSMWIGTRKGLVQYRDGKLRTFGVKDGLPGNGVGVTYVDKAGNLWVGTRHGLSRFDGREFKNYTTRDGLSSDTVLCIQEDQAGTLWVGTERGGVNGFADGKFRSYTTRDGLSGDTIYSIYIEKDNSLWMAADTGGLNLLRNGVVTNFTAAPEMSRDSVFQVLDDNRGRLWLTSNKGIISFDKNRLNDFAAGKVQTLKVTHYDTADGMKSRECNGGFQPAGWRGRDGRLYFSTSGGVGVLDPADLENCSVRPKVTVEHLIIDDREYSATEGLTVPAGKGRLEFQFTAPSFRAPEKLKFRYMLEGFDRDWNTVGPSRTAYYTNIPHGEYRFRVQVGTSDTWRAQAVTPGFILEPHFYQTKTFYFLVIISVFSLCCAIYRIRMDQIALREQKLIELVDERTSALRDSEAQLRQSRDELEVRVRERTRELTRANAALEEEIDTRRQAEEQLILAKEAAEAGSRAKSEFLANMSHEIRTPINGILGMTELALTTNLDAEQREYLEIVKYSVDSLLSIVNDILDFSKIEARKLTLDRTDFKLRSSLAELVRSLHLRARQKNLLLDLEVEDSVPENLIGDPLRIRQILLNLLDNALKFTSKGGISLRVSGKLKDLDEVALHFTVSDSGIGIPLEKQRTIFEAFSQADTSSTRRYGGTGLGLTISYQLAVIMGGSLWVESKPGQGSTFHFTARLALDPAQVPSGVEVERPDALPA